MFIIWFIVYICNFVKSYLNTKYIVSRTRMPYITFAQQYPFVKDYEYGIFLSSSICSLPPIPNFPLASYISKLSVVKKKISFVATTSLEKKVYI